MTRINTTTGIALALFVALAAASAASAEWVTRYVSTQGADEYTYYRRLPGIWGWGRIQVTNECTNPRNPCATIEHALSRYSGSDHGEIHVAAGTYHEDFSVFSNNDSVLSDSTAPVTSTVPYPNKTDITISGSWTEDFTDRTEKERTTDVFGQISLKASSGGTIDIEFSDMDFGTERCEASDCESTFYVQAGTPSRDAPFFDAIAQRGTVKVTFRNSVIRNYTAPSIDAYTGRFSSVELNLIDVALDAFLLHSGAARDGSVQASAVTGRNSPYPEFSHLTVNIQDTRTNWGGGGSSNFREWGFAGGWLNFKATGRGALAVVDVSKSVIRDGEPYGIVADSSRNGKLSLHVENSIVFDNEGAGIQAMGSGTEVTLLNDTITRNRVGLLACGAFAEVTNSIVWGNRSYGFNVEDGWVPMPPEDIQAGCDGSIVEASYSDIGGVDASFRGAYRDLGWNLNVDPEFINTSSARDFDAHLHPESPLIDRGLCSEYDLRGELVRVAPEDDIHGHPRPMGDGCDIGADEVVPE
jgi:hypothetical protein